MSRMIKSKKLGQGRWFLRHFALTVAFAGALGAGGEAMAQAPVVPPIIKPPIILPPINPGCPANHVCPQAAGVRQLNAAHGIPVRDPKPPFVGPAGIIGR
jgi:hypothetical protein